MCLVSDSVEIHGLLFDWVDMNFVVRWVSFDLRVRFKDWKFLWFGKFLFVNMYTFAVCVL